MPLIRDIDHVAVAVESIEEAPVLFQDVLGGTFVGGGDDGASGVRAVRVQLPGLRIELLQPLPDDTRLRAHIDERWDRPAEGLGVEDVLAGRAIWADGRARLRAPGDG